MGHFDTDFGAVLSGGGTGCGFDAAGQFGPSFGTLIQTLASGAERRTSTRPPVRRYELQRSQITDNQQAWQRTLSFFLQTGGGLHSFLIRDPSDFSTYADHKTNPADLPATPVSSPSPALAAAGLSIGDTVQLLKFYNQDPTSVMPPHTRVITKPIPDTLLVYFGQGSGPRTEGVDYTVDWTRGQITLLVDPGPNAIYADCLFWTPVRFGESIDDWLQADVGRGDVEAGLRNLEMIEVLEGVEGPEILPTGGLENVQLTGTVQIGLNSARTWVVDPISTGLNLILPDADIHEGSIMDQMPQALGGPYFVILNRGSDPFDVTSPGIGVIRTIAPDEMWSFFLSGSDGSTNRTWISGK
ncbi:MAG: DUF2460 domain-containing protein [Planctomycetota bacterium]